MLVELGSFSKLTLWHPWHPCDEGHGHGHGVFWHFHQPIHCSH